MGARIAMGTAWWISRTSCALLASMRRGVRDSRGAGWVGRAGSEIGGRARGGVRMALSPGAASLLGGGAGRGLGRRWLGRGRGGGVDAWRREFWWVPVGDRGFGDDGVVGGWCWCREKESTVGMV